MTVVQRVAWVLLLVLGVFPVVAPVLDVVGVTRSGIPADHVAAFNAVSGSAWTSAQQGSAGIASYVSLLETGYALHELVFGLLFLVIVAIPFRTGQPWAWWACWIVLIADVGYTVTFGRYDSTLLRQSLIPDVALPVLLLVQIPRFFGRKLANP